MNFATSFALALSLLVQIAACEFRAVCKTEYSYVLNQFSRLASDFQIKLEEVQACLLPTVKERKACLDKTKIPHTYNMILSKKDEFGGYVFRSPLTAVNVNYLHQIQGRALNDVVTKKMYAKDIPLYEYDVLTHAGIIKRILEYVPIGIKVKTDKSEIIKTIRNDTLSVREHFGTIKTCIANEGASVCKNSFAACIYRNLKLYDCAKELNSLLTSLPASINLLGGPKAIDDIDLKIELNRCLNEKAHLLIDFDKTMKQDLEMSEYDWCLSDKEIEELKRAKFGWHLIKMVSFIFGLTALVVLIVVYFKKRAAPSDEEKVEIENEEIDDEE